MNTMIKLAAILLLAGCSSSVQDSKLPPTPWPEDIPISVPGEMTLAGSDRSDISRFLNVRWAFYPSLSPEGTRLAFNTSITGSPQLWVVDTEGGWPHQLTFGESITFHQWSPDGEWILYGQDRAGDGREGYYLIAPDGMAERELMPPSEAFRVFGSFTRDGRYIAYGTTERTGTDFDLHLLDLETGEDRLVFEGRMGLYPASFRPDGGAVILTENRGEDANDVYLFDFSSSRLDTLFAPPDRAAYSSFSWLPDGSGFFLVTNQQGEYAALARFNVERRQLDIVEDPGYDVFEAALSPDGRFLAWSTNERGSFRLHVDDLRSGARREASSLPHGPIMGLQWAGNAPVLSMMVFSPTIPGDIWTWNPETDVLHRATHSAAAGLDLTRMVEPEHYSFSSMDGLEIHAFLYLPHEGTTASPPPVLLNVHGGPTGQALPFFLPDHQYLLSRGIAVLDLNFRGSTGYGKSFARLNDRRLRENELLDLEAAVRWLEARDDVDGSRVAIMGHSYGGYLTMAAVTRLPDIFASGVSIVGVSNWVTALEGAMPQLQASDRIEYGDINDPEDREFFHRISPVRYVENVRAPVMIIHGANDPAVPVEESDQFVQAIREIGGDVEYLRFPDEGHSIRQLNNRIIAYRRVAAFLERTLGTEDVKTED